MEKKAKILVVDDDIDIRESMKLILEGQKYQVDTAANAEEALAALGASVPDLILLDVMMTTDTEGFDFSYKLRDTPEYQNIPILFLTGFLDKVRNEGPDQFQHILGEQWHAKALLEKPVPPETLVEKVREALSGKR